MRKAKKKKIIFFAILPVPIITVIVSTSLFFQNVKKTDELNLLKGELDKLSFNSAFLHEGLLRVNTNFSYDFDEVKNSTIEIREGAERIKLFKVDELNGFDADSLQEIVDRQLLNVERVKMAKAAERNSIDFFHMITLYDSFKSLSARDQNLIFKFISYMMQEQITDDREHSKLLEEVFDDVRKRAVHNNFFQIFLSHGKNLLRNRKQVARGMNEIQKSEVSKRFKSASYLVEKKLLQMMKTRQQYQAILFSGSIFLLIIILGGIFLLNSLNERMRELTHLPLNNPGPVAKITLRGKLLLLNEAARRLFQLREGDNVLNILPAKTRHGISERFSFQDEFCSGGQCFLLEYRYLEEYQNYFIYGVDVTRQKRLERNLVSQKESLDIAALVSETDLDGIITYTNDRFCEVAGYTREELVGRPHSLISSKKHPRSFWVEMWETISTGGVWKGEVCNRAKDGSLYWVEATIMPIEAEEGVITGYRAIRVDITDKKIATAQLLHSAKLASIGELAAGVGHEINNPLAIIKGNVARIKQKIKNEEFSEEFRNYFEGVEDSVERIANITNGLRTYGRSHGEETGDFDVHEQIDKSLKFVSNMYEKEGINITFEKKAEEFFLHGNVGKFQQVFMNILSNAKDALEGFSNKRIFIKTENRDKEIVIYIKDTGVGISDEIKDKIFESYFTTKEMGKGTGIGLGITFSIVNAMKGKIEVESQAGEGALFKISLPYVKSCEEKEMNQTSDQEMEKLSGEVLVVDDEKGIRDLLAEDLKDIGFEVDLAASGIEALEKVKEKKYDYIFTDLKMPEMSGEEFVKNAKEMENGQTLYIVISGGIGTNFSNQKNLPHDVGHGQIGKPFDLEKIYQEVIRVRDIRRLV